ncbi:hypothetical protein AQUCO_01400764v1 [Aquilegia coerulea]|uniref:Cyclin-dependent protein kinase inhibitor SMR13 n=1 Tax=Aquilegia coerulea TaxID=218851 RepID=A0A2G5DXW9_AQUCA|nr:hypothetical protein AQUCO_01400764v1 [Aquilegia coerulea]
MARKRRIQYKKKLHQPKTREDTTMKIPYSPTSSTTSVDEEVLKNEDKEVQDSSGFEVSSSDCSTPKAQRHQIPKIVLCPPAPKKRKIVSPCSSLRSPISFFAPPDIEHFFYFAVHTIV